MSGPVPLENQEAAQWALERRKAGHATESHHVVACVAEFQALERQFVPDAASRLRASDGFGEAVAAPH